jgi:small-conductance mechanosensitive channel
VWCWVATRNFLEYTEVVEQLNFGIVRIVEKSGTSFAFPTRVLFMAKDGVIDLERELRREVEARRTRGDSAAATVPETGTGDPTPGAPAGA